MSIFMSPRLWLFVWGGLGAALVAYVMIAASVQPGAPAAPSVYKRDAALLVGEMADFDYAFPPRPAPEIPFQLDGEDVFLADFKGKVTLVNFWATWCTPCLAELPSLNDLQGALGGEDFTVVAIASDPKGPEAARAFLDRLGVDRLALYADQRLRFTSAIGGAAVIPVSILFDREGVEIGRLVGEADWASTEARALILSAVNG